MSGLRVSGDVVVVMAKYPEEGKVKTRLASKLGPRGACDLYEAFLRDLAAQCAARPWQVVWAIDPPGRVLDTFVGRAPTIDQRGGDLAERMNRCFEDLFAAGARRVVMVGADAPHVAPEGIESAFAALSQHDVAIVASRDGGYCLIGLRARCDLFTGIEMSTARVLAATRQRAAEQGLSLAIVDETFDVDEADDLERLAALMRESPLRLPHTAAAMRRWVRRGGS